MKFLGMLIFYALMGGVGYMAYPHVLPYLLPKEEPVAREVTLPDGRKVVVNLASVTAEDFPDAVVLKEIVTLTSSDGTSLQVGAGQEVKPTAMKGRELQVKDLSLPYGGLISVDATNFEERALENVVKRFQGGADLSPSVDENAEEEVLETADKTEEMADESADEKEMDAEEAQEEALEEDSDVELGPEEIVEAMKAALEGDPLTEFQSDQVSEYTAGERESVDGKEYQTGTVSYEAETLFGKRALTAKALITGGKVVKWISPKSGIELR